MFPNRPPAPNVSNSQFNYSITETLDRIKEEFSFVQQQYHSLHVEREKLLGERSDMQRICVMYYEMANGLNLEMHRQMEIAKRLNAILTQVMPFLSQEHQTQVASAIDRAKQVTMQELNSVLAAQMEDSKGMSKFANGSNSDNLELYKSGMNNHGSNSSNPSLELLNGFMSAAAAAGVSTSGSNPASFMMPPPGSSPARDGDKLEDKQKAAMAAASAAASSLLFSSHNTNSINSNANSSSTPQTSSAQGSVAAVAAALGMSIPQSTQSQMNSSGASSPRSTTSSTSGNPSKQNNISSTNNGNSNSNQNSNINSALAALGASGLFNNPQGPLGPAQAAALAAVAGLNPNSMPGLAAAAVASMRQGTSSPVGSNPGPTHDEKRRKLMNDKSGRRSGGGITSGGDFSPQSGGSGYPTTSSAPAVGSSRGGNDGRSKHSIRHTSNTCLGPGAYSFVVSDNMKMKPCSIASQANAVTGPSIPKRLQHIASLPHGEVVCAVTIGPQPIGRLQNSSTDFSPHFAYTGGRGCVKLWDLGQVYDQHLQQSSTSSSAFINNRVMDTSLPISTFDCLKHDSYVRSIKLLPDASGIVIGGESNSLTVWDLGESFRRKTDLNFEAPACYALALSNDGKLCFSCCSDGQVTLWDIHNQRVVGHFLAHMDGASCIEVGPHENTLWTGGLDCAVRCWDLRASTTEELHKIPFKSQVFSLGLWNTQNLKISKTSSNKAVKNNNNNIANNNGNHKEENSPNPESDEPASNCSNNNNNPSENNTDTEDPDASHDREPREEPDKEGDDASIEKLEPDNPLYAIKNTQNLSDLWLAVGLETSEVEVVAVGSHGPYVPTCISELDPGFVATSPRHYRLTHHDSCVLALKFANKADWFITTGKDHQVNAWRSPYGACLLETKEAASVLTCDISKDDKFIVTGSGDKRANLYEVIYDL